jgi:pyridoxine 4-dehydrogenase
MSRAGLTWRPTIPSEEQAFAAMRAALAANCNLWNGGEFYGTPENNSLTLLKKYYAKYPEDADKVVLNIKGATRPNLQPDGSPEFIKTSVNHCLEMLGGRGRIDMFECARRDPNVPLEQTLGALATLVNEGKIGGVALSEVSAGTIREAAKITKIVAVEVELSLWSTEPLTNGIAKVCAELHIPIIA